MVDFAAAFTTITAGLGVLEELNQVDREYDKASLKLKAAELTTALAGAQIALVEAQVALKDSEAGIEQLKQTLAKHASTVEYEGYLYDAGEDGKPTGIAYCPRCWTKDRVLMRLFSKGHMYMNVECPECRVDYPNVPSFMYPSSST